MNAWTYIGQLCDNAIDRTASCESHDSDDTVQPGCHEPTSSVSDQLSACQYLIAGDTVSDAASITDLPSCHYSSKHTALLASTPLTAPTSSVLVTPPPLHCSVRLRHVRGTGNSLRHAHHRPHPSTPAVRDHGTAVRHCLDRHPSSRTPAARTGRRSLPQWCTWTSWLM